MTQQFRDSAGWPWRTPEGSRKVKVSEVVRDERLQPRVSTDPALVRRYATAMETGSTFPPVKLAQINGKLHLLCGWHRFEAATLKLGQDKVQAEVVPLTFKAAKWEAAKDNLENGQAYKTSDMRRVFRAYVEAGQYKKPGGTLKSYREIAKETQCKRSSLHNWMQADFRKVAAAMAGDQEGNEAAEAPDLNPETELRRLIERSARELEEYCNKLQDPETRFLVVEDMEWIVGRMKQQPCSPPSV